MVRKVIGPRERREPPEKVRFLPDSPEQIEESVKNLHPELDRVFEEAIDRAKKTKGK